MNTSAVSKLLGVSSSTVGRWVKHLELDMERNEFGHYIYTEDDIEALKTFKEQIQSGVPVQNIQMNKKPRKASLKLPQKSLSDHTLIDRLHKIERDLDNKADSVVSYQVLQHRREIEELRSQVEILYEKFETLMAATDEQEMSKSSISQTNEIKKRRKRNGIKNIFGL